MARIVEILPQDSEMEELTSPKNAQAAKALKRRQEVKRRLDDYLERAELKKALGLDDEDDF
ncbi:hypothetical protein SHAM105786_16445 [Shewanella amazonensis]|uniref:Uncharacterized protein n=1 Tax=Shewanella amazonensis (strain ATCC BAA-1098 / SB2B) TaxID=326297 RepID=A1SAG0_SHEAM|nr:MULTISPECIES: hypothetical protein [Shewanella]ABM01367.1 conserved hypothetical protein [Shewanella amazonensis SB2B]QYJ74914.1 hypothetical protein K0H79_16455 [Shewanella sp. FJAT-52076]QYK04783.1 hypothetical protein K0H63_17295 [Shewanella zhangzhouensis]